MQGQYYARVIAVDSDTYEDPGIEAAVAELKAAWEQESAAEVVVVAVEPAPAALELSFDAVRAVRAGINGEIQRVIANSTGLRPSQISLDDVEIEGMLFVGLVATPWATYQQLGSPRTIAANFLYQFRGEIYESSQVPGLVELAGFDSRFGFAGFTPLGRILFQNEDGDVDIESTIRLLQRSARQRTLTADFWQSTPRDRTLQLIDGVFAGHEGFINDLGVPQLDYYLQPDDFELSLERVVDPACGVDNTNFGTLSSSLASSIGWEYAVVGVHGTSDYMRFYAPGVPVGPQCNYPATPLPFDNWTRLGENGNALNSRISMFFSCSACGYANVALSDSEIYNQPDNACAVMGRRSDMNLATVGATVPAATDFVSIISMHALGMGLGLATMEYTTGLQNPEATEEFRGYFTVANPNPNRRDHGVPLQTGFGLVDRHGQIVFGDPFIRRMVPPAMPHSIESIALVSRGDDTWSDFFDAGFGMSLDDIDSVVVVLSNPMPNLMAMVREARLELEVRRSGSTAIELVPVRWVDVQEIGRNQSSLALQVAIDNPSTIESVVVRHFNFAFRDGFFSSQPQNPGCRSQIGAANQLAACVL